MTRMLFQYTRALICLIILLTGCNQPNKEEKTIEVDELTATDQCHTELEIAYGKCIEKVLKAQEDPDLAPCDADEILVDVDLIDVTKHISPTSGTSVTCAAVCDVADVAATSTNIDTPGPRVGHSKDLVYFGAIKTQMMRGFLSAGQCGGGNQPRTMPP